MIGYHSVSTTLRDGRPIPDNGVWLEESEPLVLCRTGLHASQHVADALKYAPGNTLCLVELDGQILEEKDKVCAQRRKIIARFDATHILRCYARYCARSVLHLWEAPDVVKQYLETGDERIRAAYAAYAAHAAYAAYAAAVALARPRCRPGAAAAAYAAHAAAAAYAAHAAAAYAAHAAYAAYAAAYAAHAADDARKVNRDKLQAVVDAEFAKLGVQS